MKQFIEEIHAYGELQHYDVVYANDKDEAMRILKEHSEGAFPNNDFRFVIKDFDPDKCEHYNTHKSSEYPRKLYCGDCGVCLDN